MPGRAKVFWSKQKPNQFTLQKMDAHELFVPHSKSMHQEDRYLDIKVSQK